MRNIIKKILKESEFDWVEDIISQPSIKVGDVYYIVDGVFGADAHPMDYKPEKVRYLFHVTKVFEKNGNFYLEYEYCNPNQVTYNPKDYNSSRCNYYNDDAYGSKIEYQEALNLINNSYWRLMGNNGIVKNINESEFNWLPDQGEIGLKVRVNGKFFYIEKYFHDIVGFFHSRCSWEGCYKIVGEDVLEANGVTIPCYIVHLNDEYPKVYFRKQDFKEQDFCGLMNENIGETSDCVGINLSNLTTDEKIKVLEKLELIYNTFIGFSQYAWVDQIQYLITDFTTPVTVRLKGKRDQCGRYFTSVPEDAYKDETDSYEVPISMDGTKAKWSKEIDGREFLNMSFIDDTSKLFESEEDFNWVSLDIDPIREFIYEKFTECKLEPVGNKNWAGWTRYVDKNGKILFLDDIETDKKDTFLYFDHDEIYQKLEEMGLNYEEMKKLCIDMLYETHKRKVSTARSLWGITNEALYETHKRKVLKR